MINTYPEILIPTLEALYLLGERICGEVEKTQPDLLIGLAHSGWMPVVVARALWAERHAAPFPPAMRSNIGGEKHIIYRQRFQNAPPAYCCGVCCESSPNRLGHYLAWITAQDAWLAGLKRQVQAVFSGASERILVVDDLFGGFRTCYIALQLLETLYPAAQVRIVAGDQDLTNDFVTAWLQEFASELAVEIPQDAGSGSPGRVLNDLQDELRPLITGTQDVVPESLEWRPLDPADPAVQKMAGRVGLEQVLAAPVWAASLACRYAVQRQAGELPPVELEDMSDPMFLGSIAGLEPGERILGRSWYENGLTRQELEKMVGDKHALHQVVLKQTRGSLETRGPDSDPVYLPGGSGQFLHTFSGPPEPEQRRLLVKGWAEFIPGRLWAGAYLQADYATQVRVCQELIGQGVRQIIDLTQPGEKEADAGYLQALKEAGTKMNIQVGYTRFPLDFFRAPAQIRMNDLLKKLDTLGKGRRGIYLHAGHNLEGRTPMTLACWLIRQGLKADEAIARVSDFWLDVLPYLIRLPLSTEQERFVQRWKR